MGEILTILKEYGASFNTPILAGILAILWKIKTNDLPHICERLGNLEGRNAVVDQKRRKR